MIPMRLLRGFKLWWSEASEQRKSDAFGKFFTNFLTILILFTIALVMSETFAKLMFIIFLLCVVAFLLYMIWESLLMFGQFISKIWKLGGKDLDK